jgi:hypothetical protein
MFARAGKTNHALRARISPENGEIGLNWQAKRKRLTSFSGDSYNLRFVSAMICGDVRHSSWHRYPKDYLL